MASSGVKLPANEGGKNAPRSNTKAYHKTHSSKNKFEPYWESEKLVDGLKSGDLIEAPIRINPKNFEESFVPHPDGLSDIFINGMTNRNRALNGDIVVVRTFIRSEWRVLANELCSDQNYAHIHDNLRSFTKSNNETKAKFVSLGSVEHILNGIVDTIIHKYILRTGSIVSIKRSVHGRNFTGHIRLLQDRNQQRALFAPLDSRNPRLLIPMKDCPDNFYNRPNDYRNTLFVGTLIDWPCESMFPFGSLIRKLGERGEIECETAGILIDNSIDCEEFSKDVLDSLPDTFPWSIPAKEMDYRKDLRKKCIFTIDPATARDLDDALHIEKLDDGTFEVGVHIADVSFFVNPDDAVDKCAAQRATSVYLVQKVIPMLPRLLCENLCSLNPNEDKLAFSVIWKLNDKGEILDEWFGRTVINSCVKLSYNHAQTFIECPDGNPNDEEYPPIYNEHSLDTIKMSVLGLNKLAVQLRKSRMDNGALRLDQVKIQFALDKATGMPCGYEVYQQRDSNKLVEEFMLLANMAVAHRIYKYFPEYACLRRHPAPQHKALDELVTFCENSGINVNTDSAGSIQSSLVNLANNPDFTVAHMQVLVNYISKPMQMALYFCTGAIKDETLFHHYALNVPFYTHFTSPIRRYPDILVHRCLAASLDYCEQTSVDTGQLQILSDHCNNKKYSAKMASDKSNELFFSAFIKECGQVEAEGMLMGVLDKSFDVIFLKFGIVKRVYCEKLPLKTWKLIKSSKAPELELTWDVTDHIKICVPQTLSVFSKVNCVLISSETNLDFNVYLTHPFA